VLTSSNRSTNPRDGFRKDAMYYYADKDHTGTFWASLGQFAWRHQSIDIERETFVRNFIAKCSLLVIKLSQFEV